MTETLLVLLIVISLLNLYFSYKSLNKEKSNIFDELKTKVENFRINLLELGNSIKDDFTRNRDEFSKGSKENRFELGQTLAKFSETFNNQISLLTKSNEDKLEKMRETIEAKLKAIQEDNSQKLEKMRITVDEKLHETLERRLGESFKTVTEHLGLVQKGLGEMQNLATGVGDLKKVLSNVKTRGILGEIQLGNILEQILSPEQFARNVVTKKGSGENVEFAIKLPGRDDQGSSVYLPIDSKFPLDKYHALIEAYDQGNPAAIEETSKLLEASIKKFAKDIRDKYIDPPATTDFGLLFLPVEGLYAEVVRRTDLIENLQREYKIVVTGPTTLAAFLNSLQMGFKTLAIEKRSSEVWQVLSSVKTEFEKFGGVLERAKDKIDQAGHEIDDLVGVRTRQIQSKLRKIQELPEAPRAVELKSAEGETETEEESPKLPI